MKNQCVLLSPEEYDQLIEKSKELIKVKELLETQEDLIVKLKKQVEQATVATIRVTFDVFLRRWWAEDKYWPSNKDVGMDIYCTVSEENIQISSGLRESLRKTKKVLTDKWEKLAQEYCDEALKGVDARWQEELNKLQASYDELLKKVEEHDSLCVFNRSKILKK